MMQNYIKAENYQAWLVVEDGPYIPYKTVVDGDKTTKILKEKHELDDEDYKKIELNHRAMKCLYNGICQDEYEKISSLESAKEIWDYLIVVNEGTAQVKKTRTRLLLREYELFEMDPKESIQDMFTRFTKITNELSSLGRKFPTDDLVTKILSILPESWEQKVTAIEEFRLLQDMTLEDLIGKLQTHEIHRKSYVKNKVKEERKEKDDRREKEKERDMGLDVITEEDMMEGNAAVFVKNAMKKYNRFQRRIKNEGCFKCGKPGHVMKDCRVKDSKKFDTNPNKSKKKAFVGDAGAWDDSSDEEEEEETVDLALMADIESENESDEAQESEVEKIKKKVYTFSLPKLQRFAIKQIEKIEKYICELKELEEKVDELEDLVQMVSTQLDESVDTLNSLQDEKEQLEQDKEHEKEKLVLKTKEYDDLCSEFKLTTHALKLEIDGLNSHLSSCQLSHDELKKKLDEHVCPTTPAHFDSGRKLFNMLVSGTNRQGLGYQPTVYPSKKYVDLPCNRVCSCCGMSGHKVVECSKKLEIIKKSTQWVQRPEKTSQPIRLSKRPNQPKTKLVSTPYGKVRVVEKWVKKCDLNVHFAKGPQNIWVPKSNQ